MEVDSLSIRIPLRENSLQGCIIWDRDRNPQCSFDDFLSSQGRQRKTKGCGDIDRGVVLHVAVGESWGFDGSENR